MAAALVGAGLLWGGTIAAAQASPTEAIAERAEAYFTSHAANGDFSGQVVIAQCHRKNHPPHRPVQPQTRLVT